MALRHWFRILILMVATMLVAAAPSFRAVTRAGAAAARFRTGSTVS